MKPKDWLVTDDGKFHPCKSAREWDLLTNNYRLHRFLTEVEDVLTDAEDETNYLSTIRLLVRRLITNCYWVHSQYLEPNPKTGIAVMTLYDELGFPLTVQTVSFAPGVVSSIHNHGTWGVVGVLKGQEKNKFWLHEISENSHNTITSVGEIILSSGDIISFTPDAIHSIEALGNEPTITFNIYGETDPSRRFEYDPITSQVNKY